MANTQASPPWSYLGDDNLPYDVAIAKEVAKRIGVAKVEFVADSFKNFVEGLKADKYDLVMNDVTHTEERKKQVDFSSPYGVEQFYIFVREDNKTINSIKDMPSRYIGVTSGTSNEFWARKHMTTSDIRTYENGGLVFNDLAIGRVDGVLSSLFGGEKYKKTNNLSIKAIGEPLAYQLSAPVLKKGRDSLRETVSKAVDEMVKDGIVLSPIPSALLALTLFSAAYLSEIFRAGINSVDPGQWEAAKSISMGYWTNLRWLKTPRSPRPLPLWS